jgi:hypothetical protein
MKLSEIPLTIRLRGIPPKVSTVILRKAVIGAVRSEPRLGAQTYQRRNCSILRSQKFKYFRDGPKLPFIVGFIAAVQLH